MKIEASRGNFPRFPTLIVVSRGSFWAFSKQFAPFTMKIFEFMTDILPPPEHVGASRDFYILPYANADLQNPSAGANIPTRAFLIFLLEKKSTFYQKLKVGSGNDQTLLNSCSESVIPLFPGCSLILIKTHNFKALSVLSSRLIPEKSSGPVENTVWYGIRCFQCGPTPSSGTIKSRALSSFTMLVKYRMVVVFD